jgi:fluoride exporter
MMRVLLVGAGGCLGSVARYLLSGFVQAAVPESLFPFGTLAVNVLGSAGIGFLWELAEQYGALSDLSRAFWIIGFLGGFTTFSAFANETFTLARDSEYAGAAANIIAQLVVCLGAVWFGRILVHWIWR